VRESLRPLMICFNHFSTNYGVGARLNRCMLNLSTGSLTKKQATECTFQIRSDPERTVTADFVAFSPSRGETKAVTDKSKHRMQTSN
jgi:hypothetical protein